MAPHQRGRNVRDADRNVAEDTLHAPVLARLELCGKGNGVVLRQHGVLDFKVVRVEGRTSDGRGRGWGRGHVLCISSTFHRRVSARYGH